MNETHKKSTGRNKIELSELNDIEYETVGVQLAFKTTKVILQIKK